jgi:hypothetical protein
MLLAAANMIRFPDIVLAAANIIHWLTCAEPVKPLFIMTKLYRATKGTLLNTWLNAILTVEITPLLWKILLLSGDGKGKYDINIF